MFVFVFGHKLRPKYYSYSYSSKNFGPNIIRIRIRPKIWVQILFVFVFVQKFGSEYYPYSYSFLFENTNIIRLSIRPPINRTGVNKKLFSWQNPTSLEFNPDRHAEIGVTDCQGTRGLSLLIQSFIFSQNKQFATQKSLGSPTDSRGTPNS